MEQSSLFEAADGIETGFFFARSVDPAAVPGFEIIRIVLPECCESVQAQVLESQLVQEHFTESSGR